MSTDITQIESILMPHLIRESQRLEKDDIKLVHYTSSENAFNILSGQTLWMRNTSCMNDYSEVIHGLNSVSIHLLDTDKNLKDFKVSDRTKEYLNASINKFDDIWSRSRLDANIYVASLSEKLPSENGLGRLSMWRAYGGKNGVAIEFNNPAKTNGLNVFLYPAIYNDDELKKELDSVIRNIDENVDYLDSLSQQTVVDHIVLSLLLLVVCKKHEGFSEEREWRLVYVPNLIQETEFALKNSVECINGLPQIVYKLPVNGGLSPKINLTTMLHKVLIGPTENAMQQALSFSMILNSIGLSDVDMKIERSDIPLRA